MNNNIPSPQPTSALNPETQVAEFQSTITEMRASWPAVRDLPASFKSLQADNARLSEELSALRRSMAFRTASLTPRPAGGVSDDCARYLAASVILSFERTGNLAGVAPHAHQRDLLIDAARDVVDVSTRNALTTNEVPLPAQYGSEIRELISEFGVVRNKMTRYPIAMGVARPARMGTRPTFGSIAMSAAFTEKSPAFSFASLESHKIGGIVRLPREIDEQSIVSLGHFLARYGAVEFARAEDTWGFLADGGSGYETVKGIVKVARENGYTVTLASGKTKPSDATLADFRALRRMVNKAALSGRISAYYLDTTWETQLSSFKTQQEPNVYQRLPNGTAILDGYPIVWTDVLEPFGTAAAADKPIAVFGALGFWWFGEHGSPRVDTSEHIWFANDQLAVRFIEEIDFDYCAMDSTAALLTAAS